MVFDTNEIVKRKFLNISTLKVLRNEKNYPHNFRGQFWVTNIDEYLWMIYDTTDIEKLDSNIEDTISPTELNLKEIIIVRVINRSNLEFEYWLMNS